MPESFFNAVLETWPIIFIFMIKRKFNDIELFFFIKSQEKDIKRGRYCALSWLQKAFIEG